MSEQDDFLNILNEELQRFMDERNNKSLEEFDHLSPLDMYHVLNRSFKEGAPIQYRPELTSKVLGKIPFFQLFLAYLRKVESAGEIKLTAAGNLPRALVLELYGLGYVKEKYIEAGLLKLNKEQDAPAITTLKILGNLARLVKTRNNKLSLTKKGQDLLRPGKESELFRTVFEIHFYRFNWGFHDGYPMAADLQYTCPYSLYLLLRYGSESRDMGYYVDKSLLAFPDLLSHFEAPWSPPERQFFHCYEFRLFERLLDWYGFTKTVHTGKFPEEKEKSTVHATGLFFEVFELVVANFRYEKPKGKA